MASVLIAALVWIEPPCDAKTVSWHQLAQDAEFYEVTDVTGISVLHGVRSPSGCGSCRQTHWAPLPRPPALRPAPASQSAVCWRMLDTRKSGSHGHAGSASSPRHSRSAAACR